jgi:hypothetical protein
MIDLLPGMTLSDWLERGNYDHEDVMEAAAELRLLREVKERVIDTLAEYTGDNITRQWPSVGVWLYPGERIVHLGAGAPVGGPAGESTAAVVPAPAQACARCGKRLGCPGDVHTCTPHRLTDDQIGRLWFQARIPGLKESDARRLIRAAEAMRNET